MQVIETKYVAEHSEYERICGMTGIRPASPELFRHSASIRHPIRDVRIHLFRACKRTIAVADDVEVPEVKIGREPRIGHTPIMKDH